MEQSSRLYSGPLSQAAQKILVVLRAQSGHAARRNHNYFYDRRPQVPSFSTSYNDASNQWQSSQISACYQYSQTPDCSLSSQTSSCWDSSRQRQTSQTEGYYRCSQVYSPRKYSVPPACQSSLALSFTQHEKMAASLSNRDKYTLSLQIPQILYEHQATPWRSSTEEIRPPFIHNLSPDKKDHDTALFPPTNYPNTREAEPALTCHQVSSCLKISEETDNDTSGAQKENRNAESWHIPRKKLDHAVGSDSQAKCKLLLSNPTEEVVSGEEDGGILYHQSEEGVQQIVDRGQKEHKGFDYIVNTHEIKVERSSSIEDKEMLVGCLLGTPKKILASSERGDHKWGHWQAESPQVVSQTVTETAEKDNTENPLVQCEATKLFLGDTTADNLERTTEEGIDVMEVGLEVQRESSAGIDSSTEDKIETEQQHCSDVQIRESQCETDYREVNELPGGDNEPGERGKDRNEYVMPPVDSENGSTSTEKAGEIGVNELKRAKTGTSIPELPAVTPKPQTEVSPLHKTGKVLGVHKDPYGPKQTRQIRQSMVEGRCPESARNTSKQTPSSVTCKPLKRAKCGPDQGINGPKLSHEEANGNEPQNQSKAGCLTAALMSDPRVKDSGKMNPDEKMQMLEKVGKTKALVLTLVYRDGTTQLDLEQKLTQAVCGLLILMKNNLDRSTPEDTLGPNDSLVYLKLEHTPAWAQQHKHQSQELFTRDILLQVLSRSQLVVCYKAKDLLRTALQFYRRDLSWKQVAGCHIQDPQVSGWLLDPTNPSSCYPDLLNKHSKRPHTTPALGTKKVSQVISGLYSLYCLNMKLCFKLQSQGLWELYSDMELSMISVLAAMESHHIHVDKEALKRTSDLLGAKMKQLEQEAHRAAGQIFLVTSNTQLRTVLFEKLCLHKRCENKKLPKTINKQQQSTSEAALLQLQDLHPLPKIILEYRQVHKIKSTFVDGILSCMMSKNYVSSTWYQTSSVTGRVSAKHPNFQALPRQPLQITKKQYIEGKEEEVVTVHPRAMFIPQEGWTFLAADFCQVELRLLAHLSSDPELLRIFTNPQADVFTMLASQWKGMSEGEVTSEDREHAKRIVYSVVYGAGRERLSGILGVSAEQASRFQDSFLQTYKEVHAFIQRTIQQCHKQGYVLSIMGRRRTLPNINAPDWGIRMQAERQAVNFVVQGSAADLCKMAMIRIFKLVSSSSCSARLIAQLHDELLYEVEDSQVEQFADLVRSTMESLQHIDHLGVHLKVPLKVAVSSGKSWGSMSELNIPPMSPSPSL
ncbi:DNA polymerase nu [Sander vitreus]